MGFLLLQTIAFLMIFFTEHILFLKIFLILSILISLTTVLSDKIGINIVALKKHCNKYYKPSNNEYEILVYIFNNHFI